MKLLLKSSDGEATAVADVAVVVDLFSWRGMSNLALIVVSAGKLCLSSRKTAARHLLWMRILVVDGSGHSGLPLVWTNMKAILMMRMMTIMMMMMMIIMMMMMMMVVVLVLLVIWHGHDTQSLTQSANREEEDESSWKVLSCSSPSSHS
jgi:hypothetical protein